MTLLWKKVKWFGNTDKPYCDWECWQYGKVVLYPGCWPTKGWSYCASFGPNDDRSHSGFLKGFVDLAAAKKEIEIRYPKLKEK